LTDPLSQQLFGILRAPLISASFARHDGEWSLTSVRLLGANDIAADRRLFVAQAATEFIARSRVRIRDVAQDPSLAILYNDDEPHPPSNEQALEKFCSAAQALGMRTEFLRRTEIERVSAFDALFIRDTTGVSNYTYQFARRAAAEGLVVVDDPDSILKCTNKVYVNELLTRHRVPVPKTLMVHRDNVDQIVPVLGLPCVIKQPDGAFSLGVSKIESRDQLRSCVDKLFAKSDLLIHWQIIKHESGCQSEGLTQALSIGEAPEIVVKTGLRAANLIGDGFYGVDLKETTDQCYVMEVNDNPNVDAGKEDGVLENALYRELVGVFLRRIRERKRATSP
jgi:glutathione synthase/RimK-type ligase-like ATP-grasp enzyme